MKALLAVLATFVFITSTGSAQTNPTTSAVTAPDPTAAINQLRTELVDAFNKGDVDRMLLHLDDEIIVTWQNGEVSRGPQGVRAYYEKMMKGPTPIVRKIIADPKVDERHIFGDWAVSCGNMHDTFDLNDGTSFTFDSRFSATVAKRGSAWKVVSFHASVNAFDNPILRIAARKGGVWGVIVGSVVGLFVGVGIALVLARRRRGAAVE
jgi:ketosteroid isomerase-like protein